jgi:hypothetical protein
MSARDGEREGDDEDRIEIDADEIGGDGDEMTEEEVCHMNKNLINMKKLIYLYSLFLELREARPSCLISPYLHFLREFE